MPVIPFIPAVLSVGASIVGANKNSKAVNSAAAGAQQSADAANALEREVYGKNEGYLKPAITDGQTASGQINALLASNPYKASTGARFTEDPGYKYIREQAMESVNAQNALRGSRLSGGALTRLQDRAGSLANTSYGDFFNRDQVNLTNQNNSTSSYLNALTGTRGAGLSAASALAGVGQGYAGQVGQNMQTAANVQGNAALVGANNTNNLINNLFNTGADLYGQYKQSRSTYGGNSFPTNAAAAAAHWG